MSCFIVPSDTIDRIISTIELQGGWARHAADLGFLPVIVDDACGIVEDAAAQRSLDALDYSLMSYRTTTAELVAAFGS